MDSFAVELVSNVSFNCYPDNSISYFTNLLADKYIWKENGRLLF